MSWGKICGRAFSFFVALSLRCWLHQWERKTEEKWSQLEAVCAMSKSREVSRFSLSRLVPPPSFPRFHILKCFTRLISSGQSRTNWLSTASALLNKFLKNFKINKTKAKDCSRRNASYSVCISNWYKSDKKLKNGPKIVLFLFRMKQVVVVHLHEILQSSNWQSSVIFLCVSDHQLSRNCLKLTRSLFCCSSSKVLVMLDSKHKSLFV